MDRVQKSSRDASGVGPSDQESASTQGSDQAKGAGRPAGYFRANHFKLRPDLPKQHGRVTVECIRCSDTMESRADKMQDHILQHSKRITPEL